MEKLRCLPEVGKQNATFSPDFTQPGKGLLEVPCIPFVADDGGGRRQHECILARDGQRHQRSGLQALVRSLLQRTCSTNIHPRILFDSFLLTLLTSSYRSISHTLVPVRDSVHRLVRSMRSTMCQTSKVKCGRSVEYFSLRGGKTA